MMKRFFRTKKRKKALAFVMIASLCMSQVTVGSLGAEITTDTVPTPAGTVEVTVTTEITTSETSDSAGNTVETTITTESWTSETESAESPTIDSESTADTADSEPTVETEIIVNGGETITTTTVTDNKDREVSSGETIKGSEQIDITTTTTTNSTPQEDVLIDTETSDPLPADEYTIESTTTTATTENQWTDGDPSAAGDWEQTDYSSGQWESINAGTADTSNDGTTSVDIADPLDTQDVTLNLKPDDTVSQGKDTETIQVVTLEQLAANEIDGITLVNGKPQAETPVSTTTDAAGNKVTTTYTIEAVDNGYKVIKKVTTETVTTTTGSESTPTETGKIENESSTVTTPVLSDDLNQLLANGEDAANENGENIKTQTETTTNADGDDVSVKTDIREITVDGVVIGYEVTKTTTTTKVSSSTAESNGETTTSSNETPADTFTLPEKPEASDVTLPGGDRITVTVEEVKDASGSVIGYKSTTVQFDAAGKETMRSSETIYGTAKKYSSTTTTDPTYETTTTTTTIVETEVTTYGAETLTRNVELTSERTDEITTTEITDTTTWQMVTTDQGTYFIYEGQMYQVWATGNNGTINMSSLQPNLNLIPGNYNGAVNDSKDLRNPSDDSTSTGISAGYDFIYTGYGLESSIRVNRNYDGKDETTDYEVLVHQFKLIDTNGKTHYVLCADLGTTAIRNTSYNMENVETADYYVKDGAAEKIKAIALNGYWGTASGVGSLASCKQLLKNWLRANGKDTSLANKLTEGQALTATQAAIWNYGNSDESKNLHSQLVTGAKYTGIWDYTSNAWGTTGATRDEALCVNYFYQALLDLNPDKVNDPTTPFITEDNFATEGAIVIKEKAGSNAQNADTNTDNDVYVTDVSFTLEMKKSDINGDLVVHVKRPDGTVIATRRLSGEGNELGFGENDAVEKDGATTYERSASSVETTEVYATLTVTESTEESTRLESAWESSWENITTYTRDDDPDKPSEDSDKPSKDPDKHSDTESDRDTDILDITETDIPMSSAPEVTADDTFTMAVAPMTGDLSAIWLFLSAFSGLSLAGLTFSDKKKKNADK